MLLPTAYCLLPTCYLLLPTAYFLLPTSYFLLPTSYFLLQSVSEPLMRDAAQIASAADWCALRSVRTGRYVQLHHSEMPEVRR